MNLCCYAYRKLSINIATMGISHHNVLTCPEALQKMLDLDKDVTFILMDIASVTEEDLKNFMNIFKDKKWYSLIITNKDNNYVNNLLSTHPELNTIDIDADGRYDKKHLNDYGTVLYLEELIRRKVLIK